MGKGDGVVPIKYETATHALLQGVRAVAGESLEQPQLGLLSRDRDCVQEQPGGRAEPRGAPQHNVTNGCWDLLVLGCEDLGNEKRVTGSLEVELVDLGTVGRR